VNDLNLDAIRQRADAATPGPWAVEDGWQPPQWLDLGYTYARVVAGKPNPISGIIAPVLQTNGSLPGSDRKVADLADAEFAAHAREDVPELLIELERVTGERDRARATAARLEQELARLSEPGVVVVSGTAVSPAIGMPTIPGYGGIVPRGAMDLRYLDRCGG
jgi:hypothetical protein